jgi:hypothetical protein
MLVDERLNVPGAGPLRHDDLDASPWIDLDRQALRTAALTHGKARQIAGLLDIRE